ncbi:MAG TPA: hypothetical protein VFD35_13710, partial [Pricia sp.]|nr:hypothetical protein [Pricia sp.]
GCFCPSPDRVQSWISILPSCCLSISIMEDFSVLTLDRKLDKCSVRLLQFDFDSLQLFHIKGKSALTDANQRTPIS